jgi:hypothetical protein
MPPSKKTSVKKIVPKVKQENPVPKQEVPEIPRIRHAKFGSKLGENPAGVNILSAKGGGVPKRPTIMTRNRGNR